MRSALVLASIFLGPAIAHADDTELNRATVIYARGSVLYKSDGKGKGEVELAKLPASSVVRALRTDAGGTVLLADLAIPGKQSKWAWLPLDGAAKSLVELPCSDGPAQLAVDGACVLCRGATATTSLIVNLKTGKATPVAIPAPGARLAGAGKDRKLVWADKTGVWSSPPGNPNHKTKLAAEAPLRSFLPSPDGARAVGVYSDFIYEGRQQKPAEMLMGFALDGQAARRKGLRDGVPLEWSHDNQYVLIQNGSSACMMRAIGGQYKCWKGFIATSIAPDGSYALVFGNRNATRTAQPASKKSPAKQQGENVPDDPTSVSAPAGDDVPMAPPTGPLALYRAKLDGPFDAAPQLVVQNIDGAAVWVPGR